MLLNITCWNVKSMSMQQKAALFIRLFSSHSHVRSYLIATVDHVLMVFTVTSSAWTRLYIFQPRSNFHFENTQQFELLIEKTLFSWFSAVYSFQVLKDVFMRTYASSRVKRKSFYRKSEPQTFLWISGGHIPPISRLRTKLYKGAWNVSGK